MNQRLPAWTIVLSGVLVASSAQADADSDLEALLDHSVVSTASGTVEEAESAPATTTVISAEDLRRQGIESIAEAINYLGLGMHVGAGTSETSGGELGARGVLITGDYNDHVLLLLDGHVLNDAWAGSTYFDRGIGIPMEMVDHIEVMLGPSSVVYGSNAMVGVVNVITKSAEDFRGVHVVAETALVPSQNRSGMPLKLVDGWWDDAGHGYRLALGYGRTFELGGTQAQVIGQLQYYRDSLPQRYYELQDYGADAVTGEPRNFGPGTVPGVWGGPTRPRHGADIPSGYVRFLWGDLQVALRGALWSRSYVAGWGDFDSPATRDKDAWLSIDVKYETTIARGTTVRSRLYADKYDYSQVQDSSSAEGCLTNQTSGCRYDYAGRARWGGVVGEVARDWTDDGTEVTTFGFDGRLRSVGAETHYADAVPASAVEAPGSYSKLEYAVAGYAQHAAHPTRWLWFNAGARIDSDERGGTALSPRAAASVSPWRDGTLKAIYAEAFRAPTSYEVYYEDPTWSVASTLQPERVRGIEVAVEQRFGANRALFGLFRSWWRDMIAARALSDDELAHAIAAGKLQADVTSAYTLANQDGITSTGFNALVEGTVSGRMRYGLTVTGAQARQHRPDTAETPLAAAPAFTGNARLSYDVGRGWPTLAVAAHYAGRRASSMLLDGGFAPPNYSSPLIALRTTVTGPVPGMPALSYRVAATVVSEARSPYVVGPTLWATDAEPHAHYLPVDRMRLLVGLQWDWDDTAAVP